MKHVTSADKLLTSVRWQVTKRMPYVQWLVEAVVDRITPAERQVPSPPHSS